MEHVAISIIVCSYNSKTRGFIEVAIKSVVAQMQPLDELIVVDDGSVDGSFDYLRMKFPNATVLAKPNGGPSSARNFGVARARNAFIALLDDDDIWESKKLSAQREQISNEKIDELAIFASQVRSFVSPNTDVLHRLIPSFAYIKWPQCLISLPIAAPSGVVISKKLWNKVGGFNEKLRIGEDYEFWARCLKEGANIVFSEEPLVKYRIHSNQAGVGRPLFSILKETDSALMPLIEGLPCFSRGVIAWIRLFENCRSLVIRSGCTGLCRYLTGNALYRSITLGSLLAAIIFFF
jgi:glycosyltransferase involved in cell wall biosynthesis